MNTNIIILAAGYATRLYPLTLTKAKPLLDVCGKPMMEWVVDNLSAIKNLGKVYVVTNNKFYESFQNWAQSYSESSVEFVIVNDESTSDSDKLGAIGDLNLVINKFSLQKEPLIVVAGDNLFSESLEEFGNYCCLHNEAVLGVYDVQSTEAAKKYGVVEINKEGFIESFEEKPQEPKSSKIGIALYYYPPSAVEKVQQYLSEGNNSDQPGRFIAWLYKQQLVRTWEVPGLWFDVGSKETLEEANELFKQFV
jgi:glucose-1-phosphate thymidylyltransferase